MTTHRKPDPDPTPTDDTETRIDTHRPRNVIEALARVEAEIGGIAKRTSAERGKSEQGVSYAYRGIDEIAQAAQPLLGKYGVVIVPNVENYVVDEVIVNNKPWTDTTVTVDWDIYGPGGVDDRIQARTIGFGRDNSDKGMNKCQPPGTLVRVPTRMGGRTKGSVCEWTEVPIETLRPGDRVVTWARQRSTLIARGRTITGTAVRHHEGPLITVSTGNAASSYTPDHLCLVGFGPLDEGNHVVYLMRRNGQYRIGRSTWVSGTPNRHGNTRLGLGTRAWTQDADAVWLLTVHRDPDAAALSEAWLSHEFNIPDTLFVGNGKRDHRMNLDQFWDKVGPNTDQAAACLRSFGLDIDAPLLTRPATPGQSWLPHQGVAAANLRSGMTVPVPDPAAPAYQGDGQRWPVTWRPVTVYRDYYSGPVHSLDVDVDHNYIADGIITHNCMTGAYKNLLLRLLSIGDPTDDTDGATHERDSRREPVYLTDHQAQQVVDFVTALPEPHKTAAKDEIRQRWGMTKTIPAAEWGHVEEFIARLNAFAAQDAAEQPDPDPDQQPEPTSEEVGAAEEDRSAALAERKRQQIAEQAAAIAHDTDAPDDDGGYG